MSIESADSGGRTANEPQTRGFEREFLSPTAGGGIVSISDAEGRDGRAEVSAAGQVRFDAETLDERTDEWRADAISYLRGEVADA